MSRKLAGMLSTAAAVAAATALAATPASAAQGTWDVTPGGDASASAGQTVLTDTDTGTQLTCASSDASATLPTDPVPETTPSTDVGDITNISFSSCSGPLGISFTVTPNQLPWDLNAASYNNGVTAGTITGIDADLNGSQCSADVSGSVNAEYDNAANTLTISGGGLTIANVNGCFGLINNGDNATFDGVYDVSPAQDIVYTP